MIPCQGLVHKPDGEASEHNQSDDLLDRLKLNQRERLCTYPIGWNHEAVLQKGDTPAYKNRLPQWDLLGLKVAVPGEGHEDVREHE